MKNKPQEESYYQKLLDKGYVFLDYSEKHYVFRKDNYVIKLAKADYNNENNDKSLEIEMATHNLMREKGLPVARINKIYKKGELVDDYVVLEEEYCQGDVYYNKDLGNELLEQIIELLKNTSVITNEKFGFLSKNKDEMFNSWKEFLMFVAEKSKSEKENLISGLDIVPEVEVANFIVTDINPANFIFVERKLASIIDIERPIFGDKQFIYAVIKTRNPKMFSLIGDEQLNEKLLDYYQLVYRHIFDWIVD